MPNRITNVAIIVEQKLAPVARLTNSAVMVEQKNAPNVRLTNAVIMIEYEVVNLLNVDIPLQMF